MRKSEKKASLLKIIESEDSLMHKAERLSSYFFYKPFTHNQAEQIKKEKLVSKFCWKYT